MVLSPHPTAFSQAQAQTKRTLAICGAQKTTCHKCVSYSACPHPWIPVASILGTPLTIFLLALAWFPGGPIRAWLKNRELGLRRLWCLFPPNRPKNGYYFVEPRPYRQMDPQDCNKSPSRESESGPSLATHDSTRDSAHVAGRTWREASEKSVLRLSCPKFL